MTFDDYQKDAMRTAKSAHRGPTWDMMRFALWAQSEMGEVAGVIAKSSGIEEMTPEQYEHLTEELGDALWGIAVVAAMLGQPLSQVVDGNVTKRAKRFPSTSSSDQPERVPVSPPKLDARTQDGAGRWTLIILLAMMGFAVLVLACIKLLSP